MAKSRDDYIKEHGGDDITFNLVDKNTVKRLQKKGDVELPYKNLDEEKDEKWNTKLLNSKLMENIISGKPVTELASSIYDVVGRNEKSAMRNARTMLTGAENAGRQDSYSDLTEQGVVMKKVWIATPDDHTRESHFDLDGEEVDVDEEFSNGCMYPGDPNGDPSEVYNCRCSMRTHIVGFKAKDGSVVEVKGDRDKTMHEEQMEAEEERREEKERQKEEKKEITVVEEKKIDKKEPVVTKEEKEALHEYTRSSYSGINSLLWKEEAERYKDVESIVKDIDEAMKKNKIEEGTILSRGASFGDLEGLFGKRQSWFEDENHLKLLEGKEGVFKSYLSTSESTIAPKQFVNGLEWSFTVDKDIHGINMFSISSEKIREQEKEVLIDRNVVIKIDKIESKTDKDGYVIGNVKIFATIKSR